MTDGCREVAVESRCLRDGLPDREPAGCFEDRARALHEGDLVDGGAVAVAGQPAVTLEHREWISGGRARPDRFVLDPAVPDRNVAISSGSEGLSDLVLGRSPVLTDYRAPDACRLKRAQPPPAALLDSAGIEVARPSAGSRRAP